MLYNRAELVALIRQQPDELQPLLTALAWFASRGNPNSIENGRIGLCSVPLELAIANGVQITESELLEPRNNIPIAAHLIQRCGLLEFLGRELAPQFHSIMQLATWLDSEAKREAQDVAKNASAVADGETPANRS